MTENNDDSQFITADEIAKRQNIDSAVNQKHQEQNDKSASITNQKEAKNENTETNDEPVFAKIKYKTWSQTIMEQTLAALNDPDCRDYDEASITAEIINRCHDAVDLHNNPLDLYGEGKGKKRVTDTWPYLHDLIPQQIASCMAKRNNIALINMTTTMSSSDYEVLAIYEKDGANKGTYSTDLDEFATMARKYNYSIKEKDISEIMAALRSMVPHRRRTDAVNLIPVNNGIFNYESKTLLPFDPKYVFISKSHVDYVDHAKNPIIINDEDHTRWDVRSWMNSLSDDPDVVNLLWQILGAIIRPNVAWDKSAWLYSTRGNNGKGTLCELMRNLCGPGSYAKISLKDFSEDFMMEPLTHASAIIVDENDVGTYIDRAANLKAVETGDVITINRKFKAPIAYQFKGFMVQCLNEFPKAKDRSESFYRRQIFIPMTKNFQGHERKYIKQDYLHRPDVLQYVLYYLLHDTNYYKLDVPKACKATMEDYKAFNDPIRQFVNDVLPECVWDLLPFAFLYDLYTAWFKRNVPGGSAVSTRTFTAELKDIFTNHEIAGFTCIGEGQTRSAGKMTKPEPLILTYRLSYWMNPNVSGSDRMRKAIPQAKARYRGLTRVGKSPTK